MDNLVVTISREFGSGGREIGKRLAEDMGINYYDKVILALASEKSGISQEYIDRMEEQASSSFLFNLSMSSINTPDFFYQYDVPASDRAFFAQTATIKELSKKESCVIVGRCSDYILREQKNCLKVFVSSSRAERLKRLISEHDITEKEANDRLTKMDKGRANYYKHYTGERWGQANRFDLALNADITGIDGAVEIIKKMIGMMK